jgi:acylphosphatase
VQGVFFRDSVRREAERRGVAGWATNRSDGAVESVFEGAPEAVDAMVEFVRGGPGHAEISDVEVREQEPEGLRGFSVR